MAENNQVNDRYNAPGIGDDFEQMYFSDVDTGDLFWLKNQSSDNNPSYRKLNETEAGNIVTREVEGPFQPNAIVYQRT